MKNKTILFLYLKTGGGHFSAAKALSEKITERFPDRSAPLLLNPIPERRTPIKFLLEKGYRIVSNKIPKLWIFVFEISKIRNVQKLINYLMFNATQKKLTDSILMNEVSKIVVLHFLLIGPASRAVKRTKKNIPLLTVVTDPFTAHPFWFCRRRIDTIVFTDRLRRTAIQEHHFKERKIHQFPIILRDEFLYPYSQALIEERRERQGIDMDGPLVLIAGGGEGLADTLKIVKRFIASRFEGSIAVVCGNDRKTKQKLDAIAKRTKKTTIKPFGYVDFMPELMNISDIIISKGGPATIMEALMLKKPLIITRYLYGQERGNVDFLIKNNIGFFRREPQGIVDTAVWLLNNPKRFQEYQKRIEDLGLTTGTERIAEFITN